MSAVIRSELVKLRTVRTVYWLLFLLLALTAVFVSLSTWGVTRGSAGAQPGSEAALRLILSNGTGAFGAPIVMLSLGVLLIGGEFRHGTITPTFLATPRRARVVAAKLVTVALVGVVFAVLAMVLTVAIALPWLASEGVRVSLVNREVLLVLLGNALALVLYGLLGFGVGALVRNQVVALVGVIVWVMVVESLLNLLTVLVDQLQGLGRFLPTQAAQALQRVYLPPEASEQAGVPVELLPMWAGGLVMLAYALVFCALGIRLTIPRDVT